MRRRLAVIMSCLTMGLCACSGTPAVTQRKAKLAPPYMALTEIKAGRKNIYLIVKDLDSDYWQVVIKGAKAAGDDLNCNVYYSGTYSEEDWKFQEDLLEDAIKKRADAVLVAPDDSVQLAPKISELYRKDIPVILIDTGANTDDYNISYMTDNLIAGQRAAEEMILLMQKKGHTNSDPVRIGIVVSTTHSQTINERLAGFFEYWTQHAPAGWKIITDIRSFDEDPELADTYTRALLTDYPDITGLFGANNNSSAVIGELMLDTGRQDIALVAFDYSEPVKELMEDPAYDVSTILQRQYDMSYDGIRTALDLTEGRKMSVKFVDMGVVVVNEDTIQDAEVQEILSHN